VQTSVQNDPTPIIQASDLNLRIGSTQLLDDASLAISTGERLAIVGPNGAGKTTLIRCLLGLTQPDSGHIEINGRPLAELSHTELARQVSYVPQQLAERISFTAMEFISMSRYAYGGGGGRGARAGFKQADQEGMEATEQAIELTGIDHLRHQALSTMSGGERQKVSIAAALAQQTPTLILDEPSAHLDPKQRDIIHGLLAKITREQNISLIVITHDLNWASADFDRIIGMKAGQTMVDAQADAFMQKQTLMDIFDADWLLHPHPESGRPMVLPSPSQKP
jgi:ABC-type cobalamin/Fe3+-siderophores transport system ATPase subunit